MAAPEQAAAGGASSNAGRGSKQVVFLIGASHDGQAGQRRTVTPDEAESLVRRGLARYPKSKR